MKKLIPLIFLVGCSGGGFGTLGAPTVNVQDNRDCNIAVDVRDGEIWDRVSDMPAVIDALKDKDTADEEE